MRMSNDIYTSFTEKLFLTKKSDNVTVCLGITLLSIMVYLVWSRKKHKLPPGPIGLPIFGSYFCFRRRPLETIEKLAKKYGNVFGVYMGPKYVVFLNDWEAVKDGLGQKATLDRPLNLFEKVPYKFGFGGANGTEWVETRRLSSKVMKDGLERNQWEDTLQKELFLLIEHIAKLEGKPVELRAFFRAHFSNTVISLLLGERPEEGDPVTEIVSRSVDFIMENLEGFQMINFSTILTLFLHVLGVQKIPPFEKETSELIKFISNVTDSETHDSKSGMSDSFVSRFKDEIELRKKTKENTYATVDNLKGSIMSLIVGGNETTRTSFVWALIAMANNQDKQRKVHEELDKVIGRDGFIRWSDRTKIPYTVACVLESIRWRTTVPVPAMRLVSQDTQIQGFRVPKGSFVATSIFLLHKDPKYWEHPDQFIPERFLSEDGQKLNMAPDSFIPFSYGKRNCPGKLLALMDLLQYFCAVLQKFKVVPKEGNEIKYDVAYGLSYQARNVEMRFIAR